MDVDDDESVRAGVTQALAASGRIDAVVACAGWGLAGAVECSAIEAAKAQLETNFWGSVRVVQQVGGFAADSLQALAVASEVVVTMLPTSANVAEVVADGTDTLLAGLRPGNVVVDMTSGQPAVARALAGGSRGQSPTRRFRAGWRRRKPGGSPSWLGEAAVVERVPVLEAIGSCLALVGWGGAGRRLNNLVFPPAGFHDRHRSIVDRTKIRAGSRGWDVPERVDRDEQLDAEEIPAFVLNRDSIPDSAWT
jgi:hypothetical protein